VEKPGVGPLNDHDSENSIGPNDCHVVLVNDGTVEDLHSAVQPWSWATKI
jgi:hypothetical protein